MTQYADDFKAEVLAVYESDGPSEAARICGVGRDTVQRWAKTAGLSTIDRSAKRTEAALATMNAKRAEMRVELMDTARAVLERITTAQTVYVGKEAVAIELPSPPARDSQSLATAFGILLDKFRLEQGEATERIEHPGSDPVDLSALSLDELKALRDIRAKLDDPSPDTG